MAFAQTCTPAAPAAGGTTTCTGAFTDSVNNHFTDNTDITVILDATTTVDPAAGFVGIDLSATGDITLDSSAVFTVYNADAIYVSGTTSATAGVYGDVYNYALNNDDNALDVYSPGDVTVNIGSALYTYSNDYDAYTVMATSDAGNTSVSVLAGAYVTAYSVDSDGQGIGAYANDGDVYVYNGGSVSATGGDDAFGVWTYGYDYTTIVNTGSISAASANYSVGAHAYAHNYDSYLNNDGGTITATAYSAANYTYATGAYSYSYNGYGTVVNSGDISASASADITTTNYSYAIGAYAYGYLGALVSNTGTISADAYAYYGSAIGAEAISENYAEVYNAGSITATNGYYGVAYGAYAAGYDATVTNTADGDITAYSYYGTATGALTNGFYSTVDNAGTIDASYN
jgi:hypothetical protein